MIKKALLIILVATFFIMPWLVWFALPQQNLNIAILNKTVPDKSYREHKGITWILNNLKYVKKDGSPYSIEKDYYGFIPKDNTKDFGIRPLSKSLESNDLIYIADTYGVFDNYNNIIYGGLEYEEVESIRKALYNGSTLIAEFNTFADPTKPYIREEIYEILGIRWSGWIGRYFNDLKKGKEVPQDIINRYESKNNRNYLYTGEGYIFIDESDKIIILQDELYKNSGGNRVEFTDKGIDLFNLKGSYNYDYWFDIILPDERVDILAYHELELSEKDKEVLIKNDIPLKFPAVIVNANSIYTSYYFAGDFADIPSVPGFYNLYGFPQVMNFVSRFGFDRSTSFYWQAYLPMMKSILKDVYTSDNDLKSAPFEINKENKNNMVSRIYNKKIQIYKNDQWEDFYVKGINLGIAVPGKWFTEFPDKESIYRNWFEKISEMNLNSIRVYTLMDPSFYRALLEYNLNNQDEPLWLFQGIWPEEHPENDNLLGTEYINSFYNEIEYVIKAIHGDGNIPKRQGRAYGDYYADISPFTISYLVGREIETFEVNATNDLNDLNTYDGDYLSVEKGTPSEVWIAKTIDYVMDFEEKNYNWQRPTALVSWPILDTIDHSKEWLEFPGDVGIYDNKSAIDIRNINEGDKMIAGFYGAYHIYPNYPDFINYSEDYSTYEDDEGSFRYGGYLVDFLNSHGDYPALVAEFGIATGMGNAHYNPEGYHHGGLSEIEQAKGIIRMMDTIKRENYMGGIIFEWMDEWAKKTWTTEPFMIPYEHNVFWHNVIDPEQNYGILSYDAIKPKEPQYKISGNGFVDYLELRGNEAYFYIDLYFENPLDMANKNLVIGIDTYDRNKGQFYFKYQNLSFETGKEFLIYIRGLDYSKLLVTPEYNIGNMKFSSKPSYDGIFEEIQPIINARMVRRDGRVIEEVREDGSLLKYGELENNTNNWILKDNKLSMRIPWGRINVTDPTSYRVLDDNRTIFSLERDFLETTITEGIVITGYLIDERGEAIDEFRTAPFLWDRWGEPRYKERLKDSYYILKEYFRDLSLEN